MIPAASRKPGRRDDSRSVSVTPSAKSLTTDPQVGNFWTSVQGDCTTCWMRSKGSAQQLEERRRLAVRRVNEGWAQRQVAEFLGVSERAVGAWVAARRSRGDDRLKARPPPRRQPFLTAQHEQKVPGPPD